jgi:hypothetical protein
MVHCQSVLPRQIVATPSRKVMVRELNQTATQRGCVRLNLEDLESFEAIEDQFQQWGVTFRNAIALQPSNSAYPPRSGQILLMGAPRSGWMELNFKRPIRLFNCHVTSSQTILLSAYDRQGNTVAHDELPESNLAHSNSKIPPNAPLRAVGAKIARITLYAFDGQLAVNDLSFCF